MLIKHLLELWQNLSSGQLHVEEYNQKFLQLSGDDKIS